MTEIAESKGMYLSDQIKALHHSMIAMNSTEATKIWLGSIIKDYTDDVLSSLLLLKSGIIATSLWHLPDQRDFVNKYLGQRYVDKIHTLCPTFDMKVSGLHPKKRSIDIDIVVLHLGVECMPMAAWKPVFRFLHVCNKVFRSVKHFRVIR